MYTEEPKKRFYLSNLVKNIILVVLIILILFFIIWLVNRSNNSNKVNVKYDNEVNTQEKSKINTDLYSESFILNYTYFHDTTRDYIEKNNLPKNGETLKFTLQELINKKILLPTSYKDTTCDGEESYVRVTNDNGTYTMVTTLICGKEIAKTTEELKCSGLCTDCKKEETKIEYEYKQAYKATETTYSCPKGYTKTGSGNNTKCVKSDQSIVKAVKNVEYNCSKYGSEYKLSGTKCIKATNDTKDATANTTYNCSKYGNDYKLSGTKCIKATSDTKDATANTTYNCSKYGNDYKLSGIKCIKATNDTKDATANTTYNCSKYGSEYKLNGTKCIKSTTDTVYASADTTYSCSTGTLVNGNYCRIYTTGSYYIYENINHGAVYQGCSYSGATTQYCATCAGKTKTVYSYKCNSSSYHDNLATASTSYYCPSGYDRNGTICTKTTSDKKNATANTTYDCSKYGDNYKLSGTKCIKATSDTKDATANTTYNCKKYGDNYKLSGTKCIKATSDTKDTTANTTYNCKKYGDDYKLSGTKCIKTTNDTKDATTKTTYTCKAGYTKTGIAESAICTKGNVTTVNPTKSSKTVTKYKTKWSTETSLSGWTKTGKTRTVKAS